MAEILHINTLEARHNPASQFNSPLELADCSGLTAGQKLAALDSWEFQVRERLDASNEGMPSHGHNSEEIKLLEQIEAARSKLKR